MALDDRVKQLERENRLFKWMACAIIVLATLTVTLGAQIGSPDNKTERSGTVETGTVKADRIEAKAITQPGTITVGTLEAQAIILKGKDGRVYATLDVEDAGTAGPMTSLKMFDKTGTATVNLQTNDEYASLRLWTGKSLGQIHLSQKLTDYPSSHIEFISTDPKDRRHLELRQDSSNVLLQIKDRDGNVAARIAYP